MGHINTLTERKSGVMVSNTSYLSYPASLASVPTRRPFPDCAEFPSLAFALTCRTAWMELSELLLVPFF